MKKIKIVLSILMVFLLSINSVKAKECDSSIKNEASKVKATSKLVNIKEYGENVTRFKIDIKNISNNLYVKVNLCETEIRKYTKKNHTSIYSIFEMPCKTTAYIYSNGEQCDKDVLLGKTELFIPQYNYFSEEPICSHFSDYKYCQKTFDKTTDMVDVETAIENLEKKYPDYSKKTVVQTVISFVKKDLSIYLIIVIVLLIIALTSIIIYSIFTYKKKVK